MTRNLLLVLLALAGNAATAQPEAAMPVVRTINRDWTFQYFPSGKLDETLARHGPIDAAWPAIAIPHTWSTFETTGDVHPFIENASERDDPYWWHGWGWYRKRFVPEAVHRDAKLFAEFDGIQKYARVYLNGELIAEHQGGYTSFSVDLTEAVKIGEENVLALAVSNRRDDRFGGIPPMTAGNFNVYGGIYRDVRLVVKDRLHIPYQGAADHEGGTFITTAQVDDEHAVVNVRTWVRNEHPQARDAELITTLLDPSGAIVATLKDRREIGPGQTASFDQTSPRIDRPRLWSPKSPNLYRVVSEVRAAQRPAERREDTFGLRWFSWNEPEKRLYLNGEPMHIHGTNRHQEYPWLGDALPKWLHEQEMKEIRVALGHNFMRTAHYPNDPFIYELADRLGIVIVEEVPNIKPIDFSEEVQDQNLQAMIRRDRNHPSIFFWSVGNETSDAADSCLASREDPTRLIHQRKSEGYGDCVDHDHDDLDMESLLRVTIRGWHYGAIEAFEPADSERRPENGQSAGTEQWQHIQARVQDGSIRGRIDQQNVAWLYADHGADREYENAPLKHVNAKGWVDLYRVPKYLYYLWQANWAEEPMVFVQPHFWREQYLGQRKSFQVDSNCSEVELAVSGKPAGRLSPNADNFHTVRFADVEVVRGTLAARCIDKEGVTSSVTMAGAPRRLVLSTRQQRITADRAGISIVTADIVDGSGVHVYGATNPLAWEVVGPGRLVGPAKYETDMEKSLAMQGQGYIDVPVKNVIRSTAQPGVITVRVSSAGLVPAEIEIHSIAPPSAPADGIREPRLSDEGRRQVMRDASYDSVAEALVEVPTLARIEDENHSYAPMPDAELKDAIDRFIVERNPRVERSTPAYAALLDRLVNAVKRTNRQLIPDDYNFAVENYNDAMRIGAFVEATNLHPRYREQLHRHYADTLVVNGSGLDLAAERERLAPLQEGARLVVAVPDKAGPPVFYQTSMDHYEVQARTLAELLPLVHPQFASLPEPTKQRAFAYVAALNPYAVKRSGSEAASTYEITPRAPVILPSLEALRKVNERD